MRSLFNPIDRLWQIDGSQNQQHADFGAAAASAVAWSDLLTLIVPSCSQTTYQGKARNKKTQLIQGVFWGSKIHPSGTEFSFFFLASQDQNDC